MTKISESKSKKTPAKNEFSVVRFNENGAFEYTVKSRGTKITISTEDITAGWDVRGQNAASRAYGTFGSFKWFEKLEEAEEAYKGLVGIVLFHTSLCASDVIKKAKESSKL